jgi:N-methylhydantoinase A
MEGLLAHFFAEHDRAYGFSAPDEPVEFVNLRLTAVGRMTKPRLRQVAQGDGQQPPAEIARRSVYFPESGGFVDCPLLDRYLLVAGQTIPGPAVIVELDSTTVIHPGFWARVDQFGNLIVTQAA